MATLNQTHVQDLTTLTNFKDWAQSISNALAAFGWVQTADTGQVNWSTIASVPASGSYVYEIWRPGDSLTVFYIRIDYGNNSGPDIRIQCGTTTNGAGTLTGYTSTQRTLVAINVNHGAALYNCLYYGDLSSFGAIMWRDSPNSAGIFGFERSRDASGNATASYFTQYSGRCNSNAASASTQQSVVFGVGAAQECNSENSPGGFNVLYGPSAVYNGSQSQLFNGMVGASPCGLFTLMPQNSVCWELHVAFRPQCGAGTKRAAAREFLPWLWATTPCRRLIAAVPGFNRAAIIYGTHALGMQFVGRHRDAFMKYGELHDLVLLGRSQ